MLPRRDAQPDLSGHTPRLPRVSLYVDESRTKRWLYIGVLAVRSDEQDDLVACLIEDRERVGYANELHFARISTVQKAALAKCWLNRGLGLQAPPIRFHILAIDLHTLNASAFGDERRARDQNVYRRFLRTALVYPVKAFFPDGTIVQSIVHDKRNIAADEYFDWHTPWRIRQAGDVYVATDEVVLVDSDHRISGMPAESNLIQLIDLIIGATRVCLELGTGKQYKVSLARQWLPLIERLTDPKRRWNRGSSYGYMDRCNVSFFPKYSLTLEELAENDERARSAFYRWRRPALSDVVGAVQPRLWNE